MGNIFNHEEILRGFSFLIMLPEQENNCQKGDKK